MKIIPKRIDVEKYVGECIGQNMLEDRSRPTIVLIWYNVQLFDITQV